MMDFPENFPAQHVPGCNARHKSVHGARVAAKIHRACIAQGSGAEEGHRLWAEAYEAEDRRFQSIKWAKDAEPGDPCGLLIATGADGQATICDGTLDCYHDVHGTPRDCACYGNSGPCNACLNAPLACATCLETLDA